MYLFADSSRLFCWLDFFFFLSQNNFQFILPYFPLEQGAHQHSEGIIWFRSNPYTQVFYSQCNYIFISPAVWSVLLASCCCVPFPSFLPVSPSYFHSGCNFEDADIVQRSNFCLFFRSSQRQEGFFSHFLTPVNPEIVKESAMQAKQLWVLNANCSYFAFRHYSWTFEHQNSQKYAGTTHTTSATTESYMHSWNRIKKL